MPSPRSALLLPEPPLLLPFRAWLFVCCWSLLQSISPRIPPCQQTVCRRGFCLSSLPATATAVSILIVCLRCNLDVLCLTCRQVHVHDADLGEPLRDFCLAENEPAGEVEKKDIPAHPFSASAMAQASKCGSPHLVHSAFPPAASCPVGFFGESPLIDPF